MCARRQLPIESDAIEAYRVCIRSQMFIVERALMLEQRVVHLPEPSLRARGFRRFGGAFGARMNRAERKIPEDEAQTCAEMFSHGLHDGVRAAAVRALEVAVLDERQRRVGRPLSVIA